MLLKRGFTNIKAGGLFITYSSQQSSSFDLPPINFKWHEGINMISQSAPFQNFNQFVNELQDNSKWGSSASPVMDVCISWQGLFPFALRLPNSTHVANCATSASQIGLEKLKSFSVLLCTEWAQCQTWNKWRCQVSSCHESLLLKKKMRTHIRVCVHAHKTYPALSHWYCVLSHFYSK